MRKLSLFLMLLFFSISPTALADTINFDLLADSTPITNQFSGVTFSNAMALTAGVSLNDLDFPPHSGTNVAGDSGGPMTLLFTTPVTSFSGYFTYSEQLTIQAFDGSHSLLGTVNSAFAANYVSSGNPPNELLALAFSDIASITITGSPSGSSFTVDDVTFTPATAVSEPCSLLLLGSGSLGLIGALRRKLSA